MPYKCINKCHKYCDFNCKICIASNDCYIIKSLQQQMQIKFFKMKMNNTLFFLYEIDILNEFTANKEDYKINNL